MPNNPFVLPNGIASADGSLAASSQITYNDSKIDTIITDLITQVNTLNNTAFNSGRSFIRFFDGFTIDRDNIATYEGKNIIYTAKNNKEQTSPTAPNVVIPNDTEIQASGETYPITFEFTHLGGSITSDTVNVIRFVLDGVTLDPIIRRDQVVIVTKAAVGADYEFSQSNFNPNDSILPTGVFNLKTDTPVDDISTIATELSAVTIVAGDAYVVTVGGVWSSLSIPDGSVLVALVNSASLVDEASNDDWLLLDNGRVNTEVAMLLANFEKDGVEFNASKNINVNPSNVFTFNSVGTGFPITREIGGNTAGSSSIRYNDVPIQIGSLVAGKLSLSMQITVSNTGFEPAFDRLEIEFGTTTFTFPVSSIQTNSESTVLDITIPSADYTAAVNTNANLVLYFTFDGVNWGGEYTLSSLINTDVGSLHNPIVGLARIEADNVKASLEQQISEVIGTVDAENASLEAISDRISPYRNDSFETPDTSARFLDSTGSDSYPTVLTDLTQVSTLNPRFTAGNTAVFLALDAGNSPTYVLKNITQDSETPLNTSLPSVDIGGSLLVGGISYFIYRVTGIASGDILEVAVSTLVQRVAWQEDIDNLEANIDRIDTELKHAVLGLSDEVVQFLENEVAVVEEVNPNVVSTTYNNSFTTDQSQTFYYDNGAISSNVLSSSSINVNSGNDRFRNKVLYINEQPGTNSVVLNAFDAASTSTDLISIENGSYMGKQKVPAVPAGNTVSTEYVSESTGQGSSSDNPIDIVPGFTDSQGNVQPGDVALSITNNLPTNNEQITVSIRAFINGIQEGVVTMDLPFNGDVNVTYVVPAGGSNPGTNTNVNFRTYYYNGVIRIEVTDNPDNAAFELAHYKMLFTYQTSRVVPSVPESVRDVYISDSNPSLSNVFVLKPSTTGNLVIETDARELDTGYTYTELFGVTEAGVFQTPDKTNPSQFMDFRVIDPTTLIVQQLENHSTLPQYGLFTTEYTHSTVVGFDTQLTVKDASNVTRNVGDILTDLLSRVSALEV